MVAAMLIGCPELLLPVAAAFAIVGHWLPVFMRFKGGAGLATGVGIGVALIGVWGLWLRWLDSRFCRSLRMGRGLRR